MTDADGNVIPGSIPDLPANQTTVASNKMTAIQWVIAIVIGIFGLSILIGVPILIYRNVTKKK